MYAHLSYVSLSNLAPANTDAPGTELSTKGRMQAVLQWPASLQNQKQVGYMENHEMGNLEYKYYTWIHYNELSINLYSILVSV